MTRDELAARAIRESEEESKSEHRERCPSCGMPTIPAFNGGTTPDERLCEACYDRDFPEDKEESSPLTPFGKACVQRDKLVETLRNIVESCSVDNHISDAMIENARKVLESIEWVEIRRDAKWTQ